MEICGKEIKDECSNCGNILECELFRQGHGIKQEPMSELSELINRGGLIDDFKIEKSKDEPPTQPIKLADWLIDRELKDGIRLYGKNDLRKIANYLLNYCGDEND